MRKALIVVDVQNDFCEGGALAVQGGNAVADRIADYIQYLDYGIFATKDWHISPGDHWSNNPDYVDSWPVHCKAGTKGSNFHPALKSSSYYIDEIFYKGEYRAAYSGFEGMGVENTSLNDALVANEITHVDVVGLAFDYCVKATALDAAERGYKTRVLTNMTAAVHSDANSLMDVRTALSSAGVDCV